jgi:hypothetical protein
VRTFLRAEIEEDEATSATVGAWLSGESVSPQLVRDHGIFETISRNTGFTMLRSLCQMLVGLGLPGVVLLFDEVDRNMSVSARRTRAIGDNLRQVIDLCGRSQLPNTLFLYAVPPEFMRNVVPDYPALYQRLRSPIPFSIRSPQAPLIDLTHLDLDPVPLLEALGARLLTVFETARGVRFDTDLQQHNTAILAQECVDGEFELSHRRLFVKAMTDNLFRQLVDGEHDLASVAEEERLLQSLSELSSSVEEWDDGLVDGDRLDDDDEDETIQ